MNAPVMMNGTQSDLGEIKDFTLPPNTIRFQLGGDVFTLLPEAPAEAMLIVTDNMQGFQDPKTPAAEKVTLLKEMFRITLTSDSYERFTARMSDTSNPIGLGSIMTILPWLMEQFGLRPTEPSGNSSDGQPSLASGTPSTDNT